MKKTVLGSLSLGMVLAMAPLANATVTESISSGLITDYATITPVSPTYSSGSFLGLINGISVNVTGTDVNTATLGTFDIGSIALQGTGSVTIDLKDTGVNIATLPVNPNLAIAEAFSTSNGGTTSSVSVAYEINGVAVPSIAATLTGTGGLSTNTSGTAYAPTSPFTVDEIVTINLGDATSTVSSDANSSVAPVPEPGTMMLLGAGFLGLAVYGKRRKNA